MAAPAAPVKDRAPASVDVAASFRPRSQVRRAFIPPGRPLVASPRTSGCNATAAQVPWSHGAPRARSATATVDDLLARDDADRPEMIDGELVEEAAPSWGHGFAETKPAAAMDPFQAASRAECQT